MSRWDAPNPSLRVGVLLPESAGWMGLSQLPARGPSKHTPRGHQEEVTLGRDAQTLRTKNYARNSVPLVLASRRMWPRCRVNSGAGGLRPELRARQHRRGRSAACLPRLGAPFLLCDLIAGGSEHFTPDEPVSLCVI